jgi:hypothetical protein
MILDVSTTPTIYINMDKHQDRNTSMIQLGKALDIKQYSRSQGVDIPGHPMAGCATAHYNILKRVSGPTIILEDDCVISNQRTVIDIPDDADAVYLGLSSWGYLNSVSEPNNFLYKEHKEYKNIYKIDGMLATHSIFYISEEYISISKKVAKWHADNDRHVDQGLALIQKYFNVYALGTPLFYQHTNKEATNINIGLI